MSSLCECSVHGETVQCKFASVYVTCDQRKSCCNKKKEFDVSRCKWIWPDKSWLELATLKQGHYRLPLQLAQEQQIQLPASIPGQSQHFSNLRIQIILIGSFLESVGIYLLTCKYCSGFREFLVRGKFRILSQIRVRLREESSLRAYHNIFMVASVDCGTGTRMMPVHICFVWQVPMF